MRARLAAAATGLALAAASPALAGPIDPSSVPDQAKWVVHLDLEAFRGSTLGGAVLAELRDGHHGDKVRKASDVVGFDLEDNLLDATLYGGDFTRESVAMLIDIAGGTGNLEGLMLAAPGYQSTTVDDRLIHSFIAEDKQRGDAPRMFVAIQPVAVSPSGTSGDAGPSGGSGDASGGGGGGGTHRLVAAYDSEVLHAALDRLADADSAGKAEAAGESSAIAPSDGSFLFVLLEEIDPARLEAAGQQSGVLRMLQGLSLDLGETDGRIRATAHASVPDEQKAEQLRQLVQGMLAMTQFADQTDAGKAAVAELARRSKVSKDGSVVSVTLDAEADAVVQRLRALADQAMPAGE